MKVRIFYTFFAVFVFLLSGSSLHAAGPALSQRFICLDVKRCDKTDSNCTTKDAHRVKLRVGSNESTRPVPDTDTYIVECLPATTSSFSAETPMICTTGDASKDSTVFGTSDRLTLLQSAHRYQFQGMFREDGKTSVPNGEKSNAQGVVGPYEWQSFTPGEVDRKFSAVNFYEPKVVSSDTSGQHLETFTFENVRKNCTKINWDPYGRIFDSQSLEPIPNATVTLLYKNGSKVPENLPNGGVIDNDQITKEDGAFTFVVPDNTYLLSVNASGYTFPNSATKLNPRYSKIYSDLYRGEDIVQQGAIQHRDIPLDSTTTGGKTYPIKAQYFYEIDKVANKAVIDGSVSHPFAEIRVTSIKVDPTDSTKKTPFRQLITTKADKNGDFTITIDQSRFEQDEVLGLVEFTKIDLSHLSQNPVERFAAYITSKLFPFVQAAESAVATLQPIPNYMEGYAYGNDGKTLANATIGVYLSYSEKPYYETKADSNGYFKIASDYLPSTPYRLKYDSPIGSRVEVSTTKFLAQNSTYLAQKKINVNAYKNVQDTNTSATGSGSIAFQKNNLGPTNTAAAASGNAQNGSNPNQSSVLLIVVIVLVLLGGAGLLIAVYIYKKNNTQLPPSI